MANAEATRQLVRRYATTVVGETRPLLNDALQEAVPVKSGATREQIDIQVDGGSDRPALVAKSPTPQSDWTEYGTAPHIIRATRSRVLAFDVGGQTVFASQVNHPGNPARPWFFPTLARWGELLQRAAGSVRLSG